MRNNRITRKNNRIDSRRETSRNDDSRVPQTGKKKPKLNCTS